MRIRRFGVTGWAAITAAGEVLSRFAEQPDEPVEGAEAVLPERWEGTIILEGIRTEDDREIAPGALTWRELPLPLMFMPDTDMGHMDAIIGGTIETLARDGSEIVGTGAFDLGGEAGREAARLVGDEVLRWVSADVAIQEFEVFTDGDCTEEVNEVTGEEEDNGDETILYESGGCHIVQRCLEGVILGATIVAMPAFADAVIRAVTAGASLERFHAWPVPMDGSDVTASTPVTAAAVATPQSPPSEWFEDPQLNGPTPVTVEDDGRVYGHVAQWGVCHRAFQNQCLMAPHSANGYAEFHSGGFVATSDGERVRVGNLTMDSLHAELNLNLAQARRHYEDSATVWAQVRAGEDEHGVWIAGAVRPGLTDEELHLARALALSGDWRRSRGAMEMIAALSVPVPGFPVGLAASTARQLADRLVEGTRVRTDQESGEVQALVAAGIVTDCGCGSDVNSADPMNRLTARVDRMERHMKLLEPGVREGLLASLDA